THTLRDSRETLRLFLAEFLYADLGLRPGALALPVAIISARSTWSVASKLRQALTCQHLSTLGSADQAAWINPDSRADRVARGLVARSGRHYIKVLPSKFRRDFVVRYAGPFGVIAELSAFGAGDEEGQSRPLGGGARRGEHGAAVLWFGFRATAAHAGRRITARPRSRRTAVCSRTC